MAGHVHMMIAVPPKYAVSQVVGVHQRKAPSTWRGFTRNEDAILWGSISLGPRLFGYLCSRIDRINTKAGFAYRFRSVTMMGRSESLAC
jgi:REP element-mobilizing transposase RayT